MKTYLYLVAILCSISISAQVAVAKSQVDGAGLLDFRLGDDNGNDTYRGLILPKVNTLNANSVAGTLYLNSSNGIIQYIDNQATIMDMTLGNTNVTPVAGTFSETGTGVLISDNSDAAQENAAGILVLASNNKSIILPKVASPETTLVNPVAGMIVYDTDSKSVAIYNGEQWHFWN